MRAARSFAVCAACLVAACASLSTPTPVSNLSVERALRLLVERDWHASAPPAIRQLWPRQLISEPPAVVGDRGTQTFVARSRGQACEDRDVFLFLGHRTRGGNFEPESLRTITLWRSFPTRAEAEHTAAELLQHMAMLSEQDEPAWGAAESSDTDGSYLTLQAQQDHVDATAVARVRHHGSCWSLMLSWTRFWDSRLQGGQGQGG